MHTQFSDTYKTKYTATSVNLNHLKGFHLIKNPNQVFVVTTTHAHAQVLAHKDNYNKS